NKLCNYLGLKFQGSRFKVDNLVKSRKSLKTSFLRKPESSDFSMFWMPDQVRHDELRLFTKTSSLTDENCTILRYFCLCLHGRQGGVAHCA
ncbi:MAG: hypothetical protein WBB70_04050, partial [Desulfobacterales bacterium]